MDGAERAQARSVTDIDVATSAWFGLIKPKPIALEKVKVPMVSIC
jgi:hypothetical protein